MKRYSTVQLSNGQWAVKVGKRQGDKIQYLSDTVSDTKEKAQIEADYLQGIEYIKELEKMQEYMPIEYCKHFAQMGYDLCGNYEDRAINEDPYFREDDPKAYLA